MLSVNKGVTEIFRAGLLVFWQPINTIKSMNTRRDELNLIILFIKSFHGTKNSMVKNVLFVKGKTPHTTG